jgi:hypothetical protein
MAQVVESLPRKQKVLNSKPHYIKEGRKEKRDRGRI